MENDKFLVYKSSAGSGKTTTLVQEYLIIALANPHLFGEIVGITFTIKATNEMKGRVIEALQDFSAAIFPAKYQRVVDELMTLKGFSIDQIVSHAQKLLSNILHGYSNFAFSTIDSFVLKIVRSFAFDLNLPLNFGIELEATLVIDEVVASLLSEAGYDQRLTEQLTNFVQQQSEEEGNTKIDSILAELALVLFNEKYAPFVESIRKVKPENLAEYTVEIKRQFYQTQNLISQHASQAIELILAEGLQRNDFYYGKNGVYTFFEKMLTSFRGYCAKSLCFKSFERGYLVHR
jgi:ATP-dependent exoDNAse (exonuclease V) beta subunit